MIDAVGLPEDEAKVLQKQFLNQHCTTLAGTMANDAFDSGRLLRDVHDVPLDVFEPNPRLVETIVALPGRAFVLTNGAEPADTLRLTTLHSRRRGGPSPDRPSFLCALIGIRTCSERRTSPARSIAS